MKSDLQLTHEALDRLELQARIDPASLSLSVKNGVVTLRGSVETDEDRASTERAVRDIEGIKGLVDDDLQVRSCRRARLKDKDIEAAADDAIRYLTTVPWEGIKVTVHDGWLTLAGEVEAWHQAETIEDLVRGIPGVHGVKNSLSVHQEQAAA